MAKDKTPNEEDTNLNSSTNVEPNTKKGLVPTSIFTIFSSTNHQPTVPANLTALINGLFDEKNNSSTTTRLIGEESNNNFSENVKLEPAE